MDLLAFFSFFSYNTSTSFSVSLAFFGYSRTIFLWFLFFLVHYESERIRLSWGCFFSISFALTLDKYLPKEFLENKNGDVERKNKCVGGVQVCIYKYIYMECFTNLRDGGEDADMGR